MPDIVVVGGGLLGSTVSYELLRRGLSVTLVERYDRGQATFAGAGILSPGTSRWGEEDHARFAHQAGEFYQQLIPQLEEDGGGDTGYGRIPVLVAAGAGETREQFEQARQEFLRFRDRDFAQPGLRELTAQQAQDYFPPLGEVVGALVDDQGARVDGRELRAALLRAAGGRGLKVIRDGVDGLIIDRDRVTGVAVRGDKIASDRVVLATGAWLSQLQSVLQLSECVVPMRGQICHLGWDGGPTAAWSVVVGLKGHYILPRASGRVVVGATREKGSGLDTALTAGGCQEVLDEALRLAPGLAKASILEWRVGLRPISVDGFPILGAVPGLEGCYLATGHGAGGLLLGPWSAELVAEEVATGTPNPALDRYRPDRFATGAPRPPVA